MIGKSKTVAVPEPHQEGVGGPWGREVAKAFGVVAQLEERAAVAGGEIAARTAELADLEARSGAEAYEDPTQVAVLAEQIAKLRAAVEILGKAQVVSAQRVDAAKRDVLRAQAAELRARAAAVRSEADRRQAETDRLLTLLAEHEGVEFGPAQILTDTGRSMAPWTRTEAKRAEAASIDVWIGCLEEVAAGRECPTFSGSLPIEAAPASVRGPHALLA